MLTFNVVLGYQDLLFRDFLLFFFGFFFFFNRTDRPIIRKRIRRLTKKKRGWPKQERILYKTFIYTHFGRNLNMESGQR